MGSGYSHRCDRCAYLVETSGPWEFYRDQAGARIPYGHPIPNSREAQERGIAGFSARMYCRVCDNVVDVIVQEYPTALGHPVQAWLSASNERLEGKSAHCPSCGGTELVLSGDKDAVVTCPRCREGTLRSRRAWIS